jgi:hypothetical protein
MDDALSGFTDEQIALCVEHGWLTRRRFGRGFKISEKGGFHTREWLAKDAEFYAFAEEYVAKADAGEMAEDEAWAVVTLKAHGLNEAAYQESLANLLEMGLDPRDVIREMGINPD